MKSSSAIIIIILSLLLASFACNIPQLTTPTPTPTETPTSTVPPSETNLSPADTLVITVATELPATPIPEPTELPFQPTAYYVVPVGGGSILVYDLNNQVITQLPAPGLYGDNPSYVHLAGRLVNGPQDFTAIFFSWESFSLSFSDLNGVIPLLTTQNFYMLAGIQGQSYIAYVNLEYADAGLLSYLTVGDPASLPTATPVMTVLDTDGYAVRPLAFADDQGQPLGVYYTSVPYGIGGDLVFEPRRSLSYLNLATSQSDEILGIGHSPAGFSPDLTWLAYTALFNGPLTLAPISDMSNPITLPLLPDSDRGAGTAVFSPDNQYIAWKEGSGWMMSETPNFHATIRIATTSGVITAQIPDTILIPLVGNPSTIWVEPVGWLDNGTLLIEVRGDEWQQASLIRVSPDGSGLATLVPGGFMGFIYP